jgi:hypothetical protein
MFARPLPSLLPAETYATLASLILGFEVRQLADLATWPAPSCGNCCSRHHGNLVNPWNSKGFQTPDRRFPDTRNPACRRFPDTQGFQTPGIQLAAGFQRFPGFQTPIIQLAAGTRPRQRLGRSTDGRSQLARIQRVAGLHSLHRVGVWNAARGCLESSTVLVGICFDGVPASFVFGMMVLVGHVNA